MKKKALSLFVAAVLGVFSGTMAVGAGTIINSVTNDNQASHSVYGIYKPVSEAGTVYSVGVSWGKMEFTYTSGEKVKIWNPEKHVYTETEKAGEASWSIAEEDNLVTVTSRSNIKLIATIKAAVNETYSGITAQVKEVKDNSSTTETVTREAASTQENATEVSLTLEDASIGATTEKVGQESTGTAEISLSGTLTDTTANKAIIGSVTVTIKDAVADTESME